MVMQCLSYDEDVYSICNQRALNLIYLSETNKGTLRPLHFDSLRFIDLNRPSWKCIHNLHDLTE